MVDAKQVLQQGLKDIWAERYHICLLLVMALLGLLMVDQIFEGLMPVNREVPGQVVLFNVTIGNQTYSVEEFLRDPRFDKEHIPDKDVAVDGNMLAVLTFPVVYAYVLVIYLLLEVLGRGYRPLIPDLVSFAYAHVIGMILVYLTTKPLKYYVSWPRPDFYFRCEVDASDPYDPRCMTNDKDELRKGYESFPSGHAAYMFTVGTLLVYWSIGKLKLLSSRTENFHIKLFGREWDYSAPIYLLLSWWFWFAAWVSCTRIVDNRHHPSDSIGGVALGFVCGHFGFVSQYPFILPHSWRLLRRNKYDVDDIRYNVEARKAMDMLKDQSQNNTPRKPENDQSDIDG